MDGADVDGLMRCCWRSPDLRFAGCGADRTGWQATNDRSRRTEPDATAMGKLDFDPVEVRELSPTAVFVFGKWALQRDQDARPTMPRTACSRRWSSRRTGRGA